MKPPPLTKDELLEIRAGHRRNRDVWRLLHDVSRLRGLVLHMRQYFELMDAQYQNADRIGQSLRERINAEPCIAEDDVDRAELREELRKVRGK